MKIWLDAQLSPALAPWMSAQFAVSAVALRDLGLRDSGDREIFFAAREALAILITKDSDFVRLLEKFGPPPRVIWLTVGNTSNARLTNIFAQTLARAFRPCRIFANPVATPFRPRFIRFLLALIEPSCKTPQPEKR